MVKSGLDIETDHSTPAGIRREGIDSDIETEFI